MAGPGAGALVVGGGGQHEVLAVARADDLEADREAGLGQPGGHAEGGQVHHAGEEAEHDRHPAVDLPAVDLGGHRSLGREGRDGRHRGEEEVDVLVQRRDLLHQPAAVVLHGRLPRQGLLAEVAPAGGGQRVELVESVLPQVGVDADELVDAFDARVRPREVLERDRRCRRAWRRSPPRRRGRPARRAPRPRGRRRRSRGPPTTRRGGRTGRAARARRGSGRAGRAGRCGRGRRGPPSRRAAGRCRRRWW